MERITAQSSRLIDCGPPIQTATTEAELTSLQTGRAADQASLEQLARDHYSEHVISRAEFLAARMPLQERIAAAERVIDQAAMSRPEVCSDEVPTSLDNMESGIEERRRLISACLEKVLIRPAPRPGTRRFDRPVSLSSAGRARCSRWCSPRRWRSSCTTAMGTYDWLCSTAAISGPEGQR